MIAVNLISSEKHCETLVKLYLTFDLEDTSIIYFLFPHQEQR